jgi:hypothetical protein
MAGLQSAQLPLAECRQPGRNTRWGLNLRWIFRLWVWNSSMWMDLCPHAPGNRCLQAGGWGQAQDQKWLVRLVSLRTQVGHGLAE